MKFFYSFSLSIFLFSCNPNKQSDTKIAFIDPDEIQASEIVHDTLTPNQLEKIKKIQSAFCEIYNISLEETIDNFKRDQNPDNEIAIWLSMANAYESFLNSKNEKLDLPQKKEVFKLILSRSMMPSNQAIENSKLKILTEEEANEVLSFYKENPEPIKVYRK